jgi:nitric oxide reductase NorE protein
VKPGPAPQQEGSAGGWGALSQLPGNPMIWILILSELAAFGAFFIAFAGARLAQPELFHTAQAELDRFLGAVNTLVLMTSGLGAALAVRARLDGAIGRCRWWLLGAILLGLVFLAIKLLEYADKIGRGLTLTTNNFFELYYLMTGFHALHVVMGIVILGIVAWKASIENVETGTAFWHMVDLIWVMLFPIVYLIR